MFWQDNANTEYKAPTDVFDLRFKLRGEHIDIDHAFALSQALQAHLGGETCTRIGVHGIRLAQSGNGWNRPPQIDASMPLSRRARLEIRVHRDDCDAVRQISSRTLQLDDQRLEVGASSVRHLSTLGTLHARAVCCDRDQPEVDFLAAVATRLAEMNIAVSKLICGKARDIRAGAELIFTRALLIADLQPDESIRLQQRGLGEGRLLGCGLFIPHRGIDAIDRPRERE